MLRALIVDDELYVRRRMRSIVDWEEYGIEIAGEAENGRAALSLMAEKPVDLLFTDLQMPGLSGIPFLQAVREAFPKVRIVVLTMHQEFELIQQAMRLGVDDYIAKVQIEDDTFGAMLVDILIRIRGLPGERHVGRSEVNCLYDPSAHTEGSAANRRLGENLYLRQPEDAIPAGAAAILVRGLTSQSYRELSELLREYVDTRLFYAYMPGETMYTLDAGHFLAETDDRQEVLARLEKILSTPGWLLGAEAFSMVISQVPRLCMPKNALIAFFYQPYLRCASMLNMPIERYFDETGRFVWWADWIAWLNGLRDRSAPFMAADDAVALGIDRAIGYIDARFRENIPLKDVLNVAALSKSHFSSLFKQRTGASFVDYVKALRVERAKVLLIGTNMPISEVARQVGYEDEKYFRRVFLEVAGISPAKYRRNRQEKD